MELNIINNEESLVEIEFEGEAHTMLNLIKKELLDDKNVTFAGYNKPHPLENKSKLVVKTKKKDGLKAVKKAVKKARKGLKSLSIK